MSFHFENRELFVLLVMAGGSSVPAHPLACDATSASLCLSFLIRAVILHHSSTYNMVGSLRCA